MVISIERRSEMFVSHEPPAFSGDTTKMGTRAAPPTKLRVTILKSVRIDRNAAPARHAVLRIKKLLKSKRAV
jgi:hypothetical protein